MGTGSRDTSAMGRLRPHRLGRRGLIVVATAGLLVGGGGVAFATVAASGPVDGSGVIHGCYSNAAINGSHVLVLQDAGTNCPRGTTPVAWNEQGPAGISVGVSSTSATQVSMVSPANTFVQVMSSPPVAQAGDYYVSASILGVVDSGDVLECFVKDSADALWPAAAGVSQSNYQSLPVVGDVYLSAGESAIISCASAAGDTNTYVLGGELTATLINSDTYGISAGSAVSRPPSAGAKVHATPRRLPLIKR
jgi:hypothetical protein